MEKTMRIKLLLYALLSAISFTYLVLPENAGVSVPIFVLLQFAALFWIAPRGKALWLFIPIFILSFNSFISGNTMWRVSNFIVIMFIYSAMILIMIDKFPIKKTSLEFISNMVENILMPLIHFTLPFKWCSEINTDKSKYIRRILIGIGLTVPCIIFLLIMLSSADAIFHEGIATYFEFVLDFINLNFIFKSLYGLLVGLYLFGMIYITYAPSESSKEIEVKAKNGDVLILNILLFSILTIYTIFVIIQFRYLFAGTQLPYGLNYTEYARKGFFELLFLSGFNILLILITVKLTKEKQDLWTKVTKALCCYLCFITIIMLVSSFYRMCLYNADDGLTRLRLLVLGFLIFESVGLVITFFYIIKPRFNIVAVYLTIALVYYLLLNIVPIDHIIAKNQVDRYFHNEKFGIDYTLTLSTDAAPQIARLLTNNETDETVKEKARKYFENIDQYYSNFVPRWQRYNISIDNAVKTVIE